MRFSLIFIDLAATLFAQRSKYGMNRVLGGLPISGHFFDHLRPPRRELRHHRWYGPRAN